MNNVVRNPPIQAILFDLGGVLVDIDFAQVFNAWTIASTPRALSGKKRDIQVDILCHQAYQQFERAEIEFAEFYDIINHQLCLAISADQFQDGWNAIFQGPMKGVDTLLTSLPIDMPKYIFSNTNQIHEDYWRTEYADLLVGFSAIYTSSALGKRKPELAAFEEVIALMGIAAEQILFLDDSEDNIKGAQKAGLTCRLSKTLAHTQQALEDYNLVLK